MPYLTPADRAKLDPAIDELAKRLAEAVPADDGPAIAGLLNYACTSLALRAAKRRFGALRYWLVAIITGAFQNVSQEFYRRAAGPYEDRQIAKNGDVQEYGDLLG